MNYSSAGRSENALQRVVFIIQFQRDFSEEEFKLFDAHYKNWREELPRRSVSNAVLLQPGSNRVAYDEERIVGLSYEALMKDGTVEFGLRFDESRILFLAGKYTRWADVWPHAKKFLSEASGLVTSENRIISFASEYTDLFQAIGEYDEFNAEGILRRGSRYIPAHIFERSENFHFHTGFFETHDDPATHRILTRVNADLRDNDEEKTRNLSIVLFHQISAQHLPWQGEVDLDQEIINMGLDNFQRLHDIDKVVLSEILNETMSNTIGLE